METNKLDTLEEIQEKFWLALKTSPYAITITRPDTGQFVEVNDAFTTVSGYTRDEATANSSIGLNLWVNMADRASVLDDLRGGKKVIAKEFQFKKKDGAIIYGLFSAHVIMLKSGPCILSSINDITERKRMESELRESEEKFFKAFQCNSAVMTLSTLKEGRYLDVNAEFLKLAERRREEVIGRTFLELGLWKYPEQRAQIIADIRKHGTIHNLELEMCSKSGKCHTLLWSAEVVTIHDEQCWLISALDITDRKRAESERERLLVAIEQSADIIFVTDPAGKIQYANPAFASVTGYTRQEALGQTPRILKSGKQDEAFYRELWGTITSGRTWKGRICNKRKDGSLYTEDATISPVLDAAGQIVNYVGVKRDITEQLRVSEEKAVLEEQLRQAQKVEAIGRLAGGVAHDFNNMLTVIIGYGEKILGQLHYGDPLREDVQQIVDAGRHSAALTHQLLAFSRKQPLKPEVVDVNVILQNLEKMLRRLIGEDITLELLLSKELATVMADPGQIEQVVMNLAANARDAMPGGGKLSIETANVELDDDYTRKHMDVAAGNYVMLATTDTGGGMDKETLSHIFEPFFTTKELGKGTGLGLPTVYGIVKQSGGHIWVYSEPGQGTVFKIYLPQTNAAPTMKVDGRTKEKLQGGGRHILVVEDETSIRELFQKLFSRCGFRVTVAANGGDALSLIEEKGLRPDLVITDVIIPGMSGAMLVKRLRETQPSLKALYMSGYTDNTILHHGLLDPGTPFIQKPFHLHDLSTKVQEALEDVIPE